MPVIIPSSLKKVAQLKRYSIKGILPRARNGVSTGHYAYDWLVAQSYKEIHLWGFDSIWNNTVESSTVGIKSDSNIDKWRREWQKRLMNKEPYVFIHIDSKASL